MNSAEHFRKTEQKNLATRQYLCPRGDFTECATEVMSLPLYSLGGNPIWVTVAHVDAPFLFCFSRTHLMWNWRMMYPHDSYRVFEIDTENFLKSFLERTGQGYFDHVPLLYPIESNQVSETPRKDRRWLSIKEFGDIEYTGVARQHDKAHFCKDPRFAWQQEFRCCILLTDENTVASTASGIYIAKTYVPRTQKGEPGCLVFSLPNPEKYLREVYF